MHDFSCLHPIRSHFNDGKRLQAAKHNATEKSEVKGATPMLIVEKKKHSKRQAEIDGNEIDSKERKKRRKKKEQWIKKTKKKKRDQRGIDGKTICTGPRSMQTPSR
eukprot:TRINITY_DN3737_c0_g1_i4.p1 TRINITY_DN3737_c0_g1~~TRINITY_DN3737_c0_g1_i4.p1  ORF type:complete len:106 (+),score=13.19 TRINITY_DN3737_c0_g1_i4:275-592(+)